MTTNSETKSAGNSAIFSLASQIGRGFDIFGTYSLDSESAKSQLIEIDNLPTKTVKFQGRDVVIPKVINLAEQPTTNTIEGTVETRDAFQNKFALNVGAEASYGFFSGHFSYAYQQESESSSAYKYAFKNVYTGLGNLTLDNIGDDSVLKPGIKAAINALPNDWRNHYDQYARFFSDFGTHYVYKVDIGASLEMYTSVENSSQLSKTEISMGFGASYKGMFFSGSFSVDTKDQKAFQKYRESSTTKIKGMGGDTALLNQMGNMPPFSDNRDLYNRWTRSIKTSPAAINFRLRGIWMLAGNKRTIMQEAFDRYAMSFRLKTRIESQDTKLNFFVGGNYIPDPPRPEGEAIKRQGWRFTVINRTNLGQIVHNKYYGYDTYNIQTAKPMYDAMKKDIETLGLNDRRYIWMLSTYGRMRAVAPPTSDMYSYLSNAGGGQYLYFFENLATHSSSDNVLMRYNLIGIPQSGHNSGIEGYADNIINKGGPSDVILHGLLYRSLVDGSYTVAPDEQIRAAKASNSDEPGRASDISENEVMDIEEHEAF